MSFGLSWRVVSFAIITFLFFILTDRNVSLGRKYRLQCCKYAHSNSKYLNDFNYTALTIKFHRQLYPKMEKLIRTSVVFFLNKGLCGMISTCMCSEFLMIQTYTNSVPPSTLGVPLFRSDAWVYLLVTMPNHVNTIRNILMISVNR